LFRSDPGCLIILAIEELNSFHEIRALMVRLFDDADAKKEEGNLVGTVCPVKKRSPVP
jgi:hypothetical protein